MRTPTLFTLACLSLALLGAADGAWADKQREGHGERDHDRARAALQAGAILPLPMVLTQVQQRYPGEVLEVELEHEDGRWVYELKVLQRGGGLLKLELDARTGGVLKARQRAP